MANYTPRAILAGIESHPLGRMLLGGINPSSSDAIRLISGQKPRPLLRVGSASRGADKRRGNKAVRSGAFSGLKAPQQSLAPNPLDDILGLMQEMLLGGGSQLDYGNLRSQIEAQINPVFDARRQAIENLMARAQSRTATNRADVTGMYNALGTDYEKQSGIANTEALAAAQEAAALQGKLKSNIHGNYSRIQDEQAELFKELGIEAAAEDIVPEQASDQAFLEGMVDQTGAANQQFLQNQGTIDQQYYREGAPMARLQGANMSSDLLFMLENYLAEQGDAISELEAARQSEITGAFNQLSTGAQTEANTQSQRLWERLMDLYGIQERRQAPPEGGTGSIPIDVATRLGLPQPQALQMQDAWASVMSTPAALYGRAKDPRSGELVKTTPARLEQEVRRYAEQNNLPPQVLNALLIAVRQYTS